MVIAPSNIVGLGGLSDNKGLKEIALVDPFYFVLYDEASS